MLDWILIGIQGILVTFQGIFLYRHIKYKTDSHLKLSWIFCGIIIILMFIVIFD